eukprot:358222-Pelagomonas_calceolata.AAC.1
MPMPISPPVCGNVHRHRQTIGGGKGNDSSSGQLSGVATARGHAHQVHTQGLQDKFQGRSSRQDRLPEASVNVYWLR